MNIIVFSFVRNLEDWHIRFGAVDPSSMRVDTLYKTAIMLLTGRWRETYRCSQLNKTISQAKEFFLRQTLQIFHYCNKCSAVKFSAVHATEFSSVKGSTMQFRSLQWNVVQCSGRSARNSGGSRPGRPDCLSHPHDDSSHSEKTHCGFSGKSKQHGLCWTARTPQDAYPMKDNKALIQSSAMHFINMPKIVRKLISPNILCKN